jgi:hypothetical protein
MKRLLNKITDMMADAALLEMGVDVQTVEVLHSRVASEAKISPLKRFFENIADTLAVTALLEMGVQVARHVAKPGDVREMLREHRVDRNIARPDECQYGDNDQCFRHAA